MTNKEMFADLKQFIVATISQQFADYVTKDDLKNFATKDDVKAIVQHEVQGLRTEMNERFDEVLDAMGDTLNTVTEDFDEKHQNHEVRLLKLETKRA